MMKTSSENGFLDYLKENGAINVPGKVSTMKVILNEMTQRGLYIGGIEQKQQRLSGR